MAVFEDLVRQLNEAADSQLVMHYEFEKGLDYGMLLGKMTKEERKIIRGKLPVTREKADQIISKIEAYEKEIEDYDLDEIVGELFFGQYVISQWGPPEYREWEAYERSRELGRPLTDEEMEKFRIDFTRDDDDESA